MKATDEARQSIDTADPDLASRVKRFLDAKRGGFRQVSVWAEAGTVKLSGPVGSYFLRQTAISLAKRVAGVRLVIDVLEVYLEENGPSPTNENG